MSETIARVRVPGSSANLGPGFDALALALAVFVDASTSVRRGVQRVKLSGPHSQGLPEDDSNLVWQAIVRAFQKSGRTAPDLQLSVGNEIPLGRGLGSSGAAAVAGVALANGVGTLG